ncbi:hypothetical protein Tco_0883569 [Tanacetum coccineum]
MVRVTTFAVMCKAYGGEPSVDLLHSFLNLGPVGDCFFFIENKIIPSKYPQLLLEDNKLDKKSFKDKISTHPQEDPLYNQIATYPCHVRTFPDLILYLAGLKASWRNSPKKPIIYHHRQGVDGEFHFLHDEGSSSSTKFVNNEAPVIHAEPITAIHPLRLVEDIDNSDDAPSDQDDVAVVDHSNPQNPEVGTSSKATGKRKQVYESPLDMDSDPNIHEREVAKNKAYAELERKCNEALQDLDKNTLVLDMRFEIETLQGQVDGLHSEYRRLMLKEKKWVNYEQTLSILRTKVKGLESKRERIKAFETQLLQEIDGLKHDRAAVVSKVVPDVATKLIHSDDMGLLVAKLIKVAIFCGRCTTFEEVASMKEPFILEKMSGYRSSSKEEFDKAGDGLANASYPFLAEVTANSYASVEQLLSKKPQSLRLIPNLRF